jgi:hypothetical protein
MDDEIQQEDGIKYDRRLLRLMFWLEQTGRRIAFGLSTMFSVLKTIQR